jgi:hypothetical protein
LIPTACASIRKKSPTGNIPCGSPFFIYTTCRETPRGCPASHVLFSDLLPRTSRSTFPLIQRIHRKREYSKLLY